MQWKSISQRLLRWCWPGVSSIRQPWIQWLVVVWPHLVLCNLVICTLFVWQRLYSYQYLSLFSKWWPLHRVPLNHHHSRRAVMSTSLSGGKYENTRFRNGFRTHFHKTICSCFVHTNTKWAPIQKLVGLITFLATSAYLMLELKTQRWSLPNFNT